MTASSHRFEDSLDFFLKTIGITDKINIRSSWDFFNLLDKIPTEKLFEFGLLIQEKLGPYELQCLGERLLPEEKYKFYFMIIEKLKYHEDFVLSQLPIEKRYEFVVAIKDKVDFYCYKRFARMLPEDYACLMILNINRFCSYDIITVIGSLPVDLRFIVATQIQHKLKYYEFKDVCKHLTIDETISFLMNNINKLPVYYLPELLEIANKLPIECHVELTFVQIKRISQGETIPFIVGPLKNPQAAFQSFFITYQKNQSKKLILNMTEKNRVEFIKNNLQKFQNNELQDILSTIDNPCLQLEVYNLFLKRSSSSYRVSFFWRRSPEAKSLQASCRNAFVFSEFKKHIKKTPEKNKKLENQLKKKIATLQTEIETHIPARYPTCLTMEYLGLPADYKQKSPYM